MSCFVVEFSSDNYLNFLSSNLKQGLNKKTLNETFSDSSSQLSSEESSKFGSRSIKKKNVKGESRVKNSFTPEQIRDKVNAMISFTVLDVLFESVIIETHPKLAKNKFDLGNETFLGEKRALKKVLEFVEQANKNKVSVVEEKNQKVEEEDQKVEVEGIVRWQFNYRNCKELKEYYFFL
jgi:hypothetical protein